jgi:hypothetical protein
MAATIAGWTGIAATIGAFLRGLRDRKPFHLREPELLLVDEAIYDAAKPPGCPPFAMASEAARRHIRRQTKAAIRAIGDRIAGRNTPEKDINL